MKKRNILPRAILATLLLALPAAADAPRDPPQYERFDGDSTTITDTFTKLKWDRNGILRGTIWPGDSLCQLPSLDNLGRLPTIKELLTILDEEPHLEYEGGKNVPKMYDQPAFDGTPVDYPYWTNTPAGPGMYWTLNFSTGAMLALPMTSKANARCVL
jgi:hypothetical protein